MALFKKNKKEDPFIKKLRSYVDQIYDSKENKKRRDDMDRFKREFTGEWWAKEATNRPKAYESAAFMNYLFTTVMINSALLTDNRPKWHILARWPHFQKLLNTYAKALDFLWDTEELQQKLYRAVKDSQLFHVGLWKMWFDSYKGENGEIRVETVDPKHFFIFSGYHDVQDCAGCGEVKPMAMSYIRSRWPKKFSEVESDKGEMVDQDKSEWNDFELESKTCTVYEVWMKDSSTELEVIEDAKEQGNAEKEKKRVKKYPNGRIIIFTKNGVKLEDRASPFKHGHPPYVPFYDVEVPHSFWGMPEATNIEELNREFNSNLQHMIHFVRKYSNANALVDENSGIDTDQVHRTLHDGDQIYTYSSLMNPSHAPIEWVNPPPGNILQESMALSSGLSALIEEATSVTDIAKGMVAKKQRQTAHEMSTLMESAYTRIRQRVRNIEWSIKRACTLAIELMQQYYMEG
jgi:hypothetical protein